MNYLLVQIQKIQDIANEFGWDEDDEENDGKNNEFNLLKKKRKM